MLRKDLLVRQLEEFGKVLALILGYKKQNDFEKFEKEIEEAVKKFSPYELQQIESLPVEEFTSQVINSTELLPDQFKIIADLLFEKMKYCCEYGKQDIAQDLREKCILLYKRYSADFTHNEYNLDVHYKLEFLQNMK